MLFKRITRICFILVCLFGGVSLVASEKDKNQAVATFNGEVFTYGMIEKGIEQDLYDAEKKVFDLKMNNLKQMLISRLIKLDPRSKGISEQQFVERYIAKPYRVTDSMVERFIQQRKIPANQIDDKLKGQVRQFLSSQYYFNQIENWFAEQSKQHQIEINLQPPGEPRYDVKVGDAPYIGGKDAKVTIVEFSDFECPYCAKASNVIWELNKKYGDKIKIAYKHFPLNFHPNAQKAAEAGICAKEQDPKLFWKMHDALFADFRNLSVGTMKDKAKSIGLDYEQFSQCLTSGKYTDKVNQDIQEGMSVGVASTPAFFINGKLVKGAQPLEVFVKKIDEELALTDNN